MSKGRFCWLIECVPSMRTENSDCVYVQADELRVDTGCLVFALADSGERPRLYTIAVFAPGQWSKVEICSAVDGSGNAIFNAKADHADRG